MNVFQVYTQNKEVYYTSEEDYIAEQYMEEYKNHSNRGTGEYYRTKVGGIEKILCSSIFLLEDNSAMCSITDGDKSYNVLIPFHHIKKVYQK